MNIFNKIKKHIFSPVRISPDDNINKKIKSQSIKLNLQTIKIKKLTNKVYELNIKINELNALIQDYRNIFHRKKQKKDMKKQMIKNMGIIFTLKNYEDKSEYEDTMRRHTYFF